MENLSSILGGLCMIINNIRYYRVKKIRKQNIFLVSVTSFKFDKLFEC